MSYHGDINLGDTVDIKFTTIQVSGAPTTLAASPVISAYPGNSTTQLTAGITLTVDFDSVTGLNNVRVVATSGNGYATATNYTLVITTGTVNSVSVVGYVVGSFSIEARSAGLKPATAGRTVVVDANGLIDANTVKLGPTGSGTAQTARDLGLSVLLAAAQKVDVDTIKTNPVVNAGTVTVPTTATLASTTNITAGTITTTTNLTNAPPDSSGVTTLLSRIGGAITITAGRVNADLTHILATALTEGAGQIAAAFKKFFNIAAPAATMDHLILVDTVTTATTATNLTNAPTNGDFTATMKTSITTAATAATPTAAAVTGAVGSVTADVGITQAAADKVFGGSAAAITESYAADGAAFKPGQALYEICQTLSEFAIASTTVSVKKRDGTTEAMTFTLDSATVPTSRTRAT